MLAYYLTVALGGSQALAMFAFLVGTYVTHSHRPPPKHVRLPSTHGGHVTWPFILSGAHITRPGPHLYSPACLSAPAAGAIPPAASLGVYALRYSSPTRDYVSEV